MIRRLGAFVRQWRAPILFMILILAGFLGFRRLEDNSADTRRLAEQNRQLTLQIAAINGAQQRALCDSRVESRTELKLLLWEAILATLVVTSATSIIGALHHLEWKHLVLPAVILVLSISYFLLKKTEGPD